MLTLGVFGTSLKENEKNIILKFLSELIKSLYEKNIIQKARLCLTCGNLRKIENEEKPFYCELGKIKFDYGELNFNCENYNLK